MTDSEDGYEDQEVSRLLLIYEARIGVEVVAFSLGTFLSHGIPPSHNDLERLKIFADQAADALEALQRNMQPEPGKPANENTPK